MKPKKIISVEMPLEPETLEQIAKAIRSGEFGDSEIVGIKLELAKPQREPSIEEAQITSEVVLKLRNGIKTLVAQNQIKEAIETFMNSVKQGSKIYDNLVLASARFNRANEDKHLQIISYGEYDIAMMNIANSIIFMVNSTDEKEMK